MKCPTCNGTGHVHEKRREARLRRNATQLERIIDIVCGYYGVDAPIILGQCRRAPIVRIRMIGMFLAQEQGISLPAIGRGFGDRDHTTALHAVRKIQDRLDIDPDLVRELAILRPLVAPLEIANG